MQARFGYPSTMSITIRQSTSTYDDDYYAWTRAQAGLLRDMAARRVNTPLDLEHLAEEVEGLGSEQLHAVESHIVRILEHLLKLSFSPASMPRFGWMRSVAAARGEIAGRLTSSIEREARADLDKCFGRARRLAELALREHGEEEAAAELPASCPFDFEQILLHDWYPEPIERASGRQTDQGLR